MFEVLLFFQVKDLVILSTEIIDIDWAKNMLKSTFNLKDF